MASAGGVLFLALGPLPVREKMRFLSSGSETFLTLPVVLGALACHHTCRALPPETVCARARAAAGQLVTKKRKLHEAKIKVSTLHTKESHSKHSTYCTYSA